MTGALLGEAVGLHSQLRTIVAGVLRLSPAEIDEDACFSSLGLDSLAAAELTAEIEDALGVTLSPEVVHEHSSIAALARFIEHGCESVDTECQRMRDDAVLADEIRPQDGAHVVSLRNATSILLTGATGFLGAHLLCSLLDETEATILCLVRGTPRDGASPKARVMANLARYGVRVDVERVVIVEGDLARPLLGMSRKDFDLLARRMDVIVHGGAQVDWVRRYGGLRDANVLGTREILRLACHSGAKPVHFISSLGVCYSSTGPRSIEEGGDALESLDGLRLGYAQSKCVAESLVREAGKRGLPVSIVRPALVSGDSGQGRSNVDDLLTRFIAGCVAMRAAPDLDWRVDCLPVDHVARAIVRLSLDQEQGTDVVHVSAQQPKHWRECVLWMRLYGYDIELLPYREWLERLSGDDGEGNPLHPLRSFFLEHVPGENGLTLPELYEETRRSRIRDAASRGRLKHAGAECSTIDTTLLERYFDQYVAEGVVPDVRGSARRPSPGSGAGTPDIARLVPEMVEALRRYQGDDSLSIEGMNLAPMGGDDSILSELTSWREGAAIGLFSGTVELCGGEGKVTSEFVVKVKAADERSIEVAESVAALASHVCGSEFSRFRDYHGFTRGHVREMALYRETDPRIFQHRPAPLAMSIEPATQRVMLVIEKIPSSALFSGNNPDAWQPELLAAAVDGAADIHSVWYGREQELLQQPWLAPVRDAARLTEMQPLWTALADHACVHSPAWRDAALVRIHRAVIEQVAEWAAVLDRSPRTLIHNDFNPRNIAILREGRPRLCAFDWELATIGLPQRDIAELLCNTLDPSATREEVATWVGRARIQLAHSSGVHIDAHEWDLGFRAALCELVVDRLPMYAMVDRFRPQRYLARVMRTWMMLQRHYPWINP